MPTARSADLLIVSAHVVELSGLREALGSSLSGRVRGQRVVCKAIGVGMPSAGIGTMQALNETRPRAVLLLGSCGIYAPVHDDHLLTLAVPGALQLVDAAAVDGTAAYPASMPVRARVHARLRAGLLRKQPGVLRGPLATTSGITTDDALAQRLSERSGCVAENLEALSVALACATRALPFAAVLVITNVVGSQGRSQWLQHHEAAANRGGRFLLDWLDRGAPGLPELDARAAHGNRAHARG